MRRYGISQPEFDAMVEAQGGVCAICRVRPAEHVDHCHETLRVRGVLCAPCNTRLHAVDNVEWLEAATAYVKEVRSWRVAAGNGSTEGGSSRASVSD